MADYRPGTEDPVRFGVFELDPSAGELRKHGIRVKLQDQPFAVLLILLEKPGQVITREELQQRLEAKPAELVRVSVPDGKVQRVLDLKGVTVGGLMAGLDQPFAGRFSAAYAG